MTTNVLNLPWKVGQRKQIDFPIECFDMDLNRIVVARVPITSKTDAEHVAAVVASASEMLLLLHSIYLNACSHEGSTLTLRERAAAKEILERIAAASPSRRSA